MRRSIRGRIALWAFGVFLALLALQSALVLGGLERALREVADQDLLDELGELAAEVGDLSLAGLLEAGADPGQDVNDLAFEVRDYLAAHPSLIHAIGREKGPLLSASPELPEGGLGRGEPEVARAGVSFRDAPDPRAGAERLRVAELHLGPWRVEVARSLRSFSAITAALRAQLFLILAVVSVGAGLGAYWIARRALTPLRRLIDQARRLRTLSEGTLPRSGSGDEIDDLAGVLNELLERIRDDVLRIHQFTADAAHEIRTPLAAIRGHLELLLVRVDPEAQATVAGVLEEVERLGRLVSQLLLLEKLQESPGWGERTRLDLAELARDLVEHVGVVAEEQGVALAGSFGSAPVLGDPEKLRQVFLNLIDNALRYTPAGGRVELRVESEAGRARAVVRDTGPGIATADLERIFDRFRSDRSRPGAGTGLGLPIARAIARAHGGELRAASPGGAEFTLELPLAR
jgi:signal transduction histidine kinase